MRVPQISAGGRGQMGITWFVNKWGPLMRYSHGGATNGQQAMFMYIPEKDFALAILTNNDNGGVLNNAIVNLALEIYFDIKTTIPKPIKVNAVELEEYTGSYRIGTEAFDLKIKNGELIYQHIPLGGFPTPDSPPGTGGHLLDAGCVLR